MPSQPGAPSDDPIARAQALIASGDAPMAATVLRRWLEAGRGGFLARLVLAQALRESGETAEAIREARELALSHPYAAPAALALGEALAAASQLPAAIAEIQRALRIDPNLGDARAALARTWLEAGEPDRALEALQFPGTDDALQTADLVERARRMRAQKRSDAGYVRHLFDQFSTDYDARMRGELAYAAPEVLRELADLVAPKRTGLAVLDLGCGTGLAGVAFRSLASHLDGIDLSPKMIEKARSRAIYDRLIVGDIERSRDDCAAKYDLVIAADSLVYLGDLGPVMALAANALRDTGLFLFTVEKSSDEAFALGPKRRWRHSEQYLRNEAGKREFEIAGLLDCTPRSEAGKPVSGMAAALARKSRA